jgi:hypothetical protein
MMPRMTLVRRWRSRGNKNASKVADIHSVSEGKDGRERVDQDGNLIIEKPAARAVRRLARPPLLFHQVLQSAHEHSPPTFEDGIRPAVVPLAQLGNLGR